MKQSPFRSALVSNLRAFIADERKRGTVSMSVACLAQAVPSPSAHLEGAPRGTNARYFYSEMFRSVASAGEFRSFVTA